MLCFDLSFAVGTTFILSVGNRLKTVGLVMLPHAVMNGIRCFAANSRSNAQNVRTANSFRVRESLKCAKDKIANLVEILASQGLSQLASVKEKLNSLDQEKHELEIEEKRMDQEIRAEKVQAGTAHQQI